MTKAQRARFYFPAWNKALHRNWDVCAGHVKARPGRDEAIDPELPTPTSVETLAMAEARRQGRSLTADDLRHAVHVIALGKDMSSDHMDNRQTDRVVLAFRILAEPMDVDAIMQWSHPINAERKRLLYSIEHCGLEFAYRQSVCRDRHGVSDWHGLGIDDLRRFAMTCRGRSKTKISKATAAVTQ